MGSSIIAGRISSEISTPARQAPLSLKTLGATIADLDDLLKASVVRLAQGERGIKTGIARSSRIDPSIRDLGVSDVGTREKFEKTFITSADKAARVILDGVRRNQRRVLIGPDARVFDWMVRLLPASYQRLSVGYSKFSAK